MSLLSAVTRNLILFACRARASSGFATDGAPTGTRRLNSRDTQSTICEFCPLFQQSYPLGRLMPTPKLSSGDGRQTAGPRLAEEGFTDTVPPAQGVHPSQKLRRKVTLRSEPAEDHNVFEHHCLHLIIRRSDGRWVCQINSFKFRVRRELCHNERHQVRLKSNFLRMKADFH